jgi:hypothetical protein
VRQGVRGFASAPGLARIVASNNASAAIDARKSYLVIVLSVVASLHPALSHQVHTYVSGDGMHKLESQRV